MLSPPSFLAMSLRPQLGRSRMQWKNITLSCRHCVSAKPIPGLRSTTPFSKFAFSNNPQRDQKHTLRYTPTERSLKLRTMSQMPSEGYSKASASTSAPVPHPPPQTGLISFLPKPWIPYAELIRLDKPTGTYYLFFPCLFSTLLAGPLATPIAPPMEILTKTGLFFMGALIMRGAGCTVNDLWDRNLDPNVERTKFRPIARRAVTPEKAVVFTGFQLLAGLGVLLQFPTQCLWYGVPSLILVATYPLAKRVTDYPQFVLGLTFSWGAIMGFPALGIDILSCPEALGAAVALYSSCVAWTVLYDMIYAHMDIKDDLAAGIRSIALRHEHNTKTVLSGLAVIQISSLAAAGILAGAGPVFFIGSCGSAMLSLSIMIWRVRLNDVKNCWWWFKHGCWITGGGIALGIFGDYIAQLWDVYDGKS